MIRVLDSFAPLSSSRLSFTTTSRNIRPSASGKVVGNALHEVRNRQRRRQEVLPYDHSQQRADALPAWPHTYNHHRPHLGNAAALPSPAFPGATCCNSTPTHLTKLLACATPEQQKTK